MCGHVFFIFFNLALCGSHPPPEATTQLSVE